MTRYIDADKADVRSIHSSYIGYSSQADVLEWLQSQPSADVAEIKYGKWIVNYKVIANPGGVEMKAFAGYRCSLCNRAEVYEEPYCHCGAYMYGEKKE